MNEVYTNPKATPADDGITQVSSPAIALQNPGQAAVAFQASNAAPGNAAEGPYNEPQLFLSEAELLDDKGKRDRYLKAGMVGIVVLILGFALYESIMNDRNVFTETFRQLISLVIPGYGEDKVLEFGRPQAVSTIVTQPTESGSRLLKPIEGNPYWHLPNKILGSIEPIRSLMSEADMFRWKKEIQDPFVYQRLKAVQDVRKKKAKGSEFILWEGLRQKKFWTRMEAAFGLAEIGISLPLDLVDKIFLDTRKSLVANYFKRFESNSTAGERFILRQAIRFVSEAARLQIIRALVANQDELTSLYLVAATQDPSAKMQAMVQDFMQAGQVRVASKDYETKLAFVKFGGEPRTVLPQTPLDNPTQQTKEQTIPEAGPQSEDSDARASSETENQVTEQIELFEVEEQDLNTQEKEEESSIEVIKVDPKKL